MLTASCQKIKDNVAAAATWAEQQGAAARRDLEDLSNGLDLQRKMVTAVQGFGSYASLNKGRWALKSAPCAETNV